MIRSVFNEILKMLEQGLLALLDVPIPRGYLVVEFSSVPDFAEFVAAIRYAFLHPAFFTGFPSLLLGAFRPFAPPVHAFIFKVRLVFVIFEVMPKFNAKFIVNSKVCGV